MYKVEAWLEDHLDMEGRATTEEYLYHIFEAEPMAQSYILGLREGAKFGGFYVNIKLNGKDV